MSGIERTPDGKIHIVTAEHALIVSEHDARRILVALWIVLMPYGTPTPKALKDIDMGPEKK